MKKNKHKFVFIQKKKNFNKTIKFKINFEFFFFFLFKLYNFIDCFQVRTAPVTFLSISDRYLSGIPACLNRINHQFCL